MRAAARMSAPPVRALGPRLSPSRRRRARTDEGLHVEQDAGLGCGTWVIPQFQSRVVDAVQSRPLAARASQTFREMTAMGDGPKG